MRTMLRGRRVCLRPVERSHLPQLQAWFSQYELMRVLNPAAIKLVNKEAEEAWFESTQKIADQFMFAVMLDEDRLIGTMSLFKVDGKNRSCTLGVSIADPTAQGQGHGSEALGLIMEFGFLELNLNRIQLFVMEFNPRARQLYERLGFKLEGSLRQAIFREGRYWDEHVMSVLREDYSPDPHWGLSASLGASS